MYLQDHTIKVIVKHPIVSCRSCNERFFILNKIFWVWESLFRLINLDSFYQSLTLGVTLSLFLSHTSTSHHSLSLSLLYKIFFWYVWTPLKHPIMSNVKSFDFDLHISCYLFSFLLSLICVSYCVIDDGMGMVGLGLCGARSLARITVHPCGKWGLWYERNQVFREIYNLFGKAGGKRKRREMIRYVVLFSV